MGTDIAGWVEIKNWGNEDRWSGILQVRTLLDRNYDAFGSLFGVRNKDGFKPTAPDRGLPADISDEAKRDFETAYEKDPRAIFGMTWITWSEIKAINWEEEPENQKYILITYHRNQNGEITHGTGEHCQSLAHVARLLGLSIETYEREYGGKEGERWEKDGQTYEVRRLTRKSVLSKGWNLLFQLMEHVALSSANKDSRLVVWFDT